MDNQRLLYIDYVKGIAILLLLLSYTIPCLELGFLHFTCRDFFII